MSEILRLLSDNPPLKWILPTEIRNHRAVLGIALSALAMASGNISGENAEQFTQLLIGVLCTFGLLYFSYIELINPNIVMSDRLFATLVSLIVASVGLREIQYRIGGQEPPRSSSDDEGGE